MKTYEVTICYRIEADSEDAAIDQALDLGQMGVDYDACIFMESKEVEEDEE